MTKTPRTLEEAREQGNVVGRLQRENNVLRADNARLRAGLKTIITGIPRPEVAEHWRGDGKPSKAYKCKHGLFMYEECGECVADFAATILGERP